MEIDHIIARKHRGCTVAGNLALACYYCNVYKGPNLTGRDPVTGKLTRLYHPRRHKWDFHFRFDEHRIGRTAIGRTTIDVLRMNHPQFVALRDTYVGWRLLTSHLFLDLEQLLLERVPLAFADRLLIHQIPHLFEIGSEVRCLDGRGEQLVFLGMPLILRDEVLVRRSRRVAS